MLWSVFIALVVLSANGVVVPGWTYWLTLGLAAFTTLLDTLAKTAVRKIQRRRDWEGK